MTMDSIALLSANHVIISTTNGTNHAHSGQYRTWCTW